MAFRERQTRALVLIGIACTFALIAALHTAAWSEQRTKGHHALRLAFCICGGIRVFTNDHVQLNILDNVITSISGTHDRAVFFVMDEASRSDPIIPTIQQRFLPASIAFLAHHPSPPNGCSFNGHTSRNIPGFFDQYTKVKHALLLVQDDEMRTRRAFDFVIRLRPDHVWPSPLPPITHYSRYAITSITGNLNTCIGNFGKVDARTITGNLTIAGDLFAVLPRHLASAYMNVVDEHFICRVARDFQYCHTCVDTPGIDSVAPECILRRRLDELGITVRQLNPFSSCVARGVDGSHITMGKDIGGGGCNMSLSGNKI